MVAILKCEQFARVLDRVRFLSTSVSDLAGLAESLAAEVFFVC